MDEFCLKIKMALSNRENKTVKDTKILDSKNRFINNVDKANYKLAAVLFPIIKTNDNYEVILTTRSEDVLSHPGQVCFPGGRLDSNDKNMIDCAKREAFEEVGIKPNQLEILGELDNCITGTNYSITPIMGLIMGEFVPKIQEKEVANLFRVPINFFLQNSNKKLKKATYKNKNYSYYEYNWKEKKIWGSTARIIVNFCDIMNNVKLSS